VIQTLFIVLSVLLSLVSIGLTLRLNRINQAFSEYRIWAENEIELVSRTDTGTGALKNSAFNDLLSSECRRAVREFTPLTLMKLDMQHLNGDDPSDDELHQVAEILKERLSRPGDQLGRCGQNQLCLLLPSTNEHAGVFANVCHQAVNDAFTSSDVQFTLAACTFQPTVSLTPEMASEMVNETLVKALSERPGEVLFHAEYSHDFNPMYT
jgi:GGDEF domain-containing protein